MTIQYTIDFPSRSFTKISATEREDLNSSAVKTSFIPDWWLLYSHTWTDSRIDYWHFPPFHIPQAYSNYAAVAILAALDSVLGGFSASLDGKFHIRVFLSGFFGNSLLAALLAFIGDKLGIQLYLAAVFAFGNRIFINFGNIRRKLLKLEELK